MSPETDLREFLDHSLDQLPSIPATDYLLAGRRVRRRRRIVTTLVVAPALSLVVGLGMSQLGAAGRGGQDTPPSAAKSSNRVAVVDPADLAPDPDYVAPEPNNPVDAVDGLEGVDYFTTDDVPEWAKEDGGHGPVAVSPDGRLWVAPGTVVRRTVIDPYQPGEGGNDPVTASYAVEAQYRNAPNEMMGDIVWVVAAIDRSGTHWGVMDHPGSWTDDFELWVDDATAHTQGRPNFAARLVKFAATGSHELVPGTAGVEILQQTSDPELLPSMPVPTRSAAAEVRWAGKTWFVEATDPGDQAAWFQAYEGASQRDFAAFLVLLRRGA